MKKDNLTKQVYCFRYQADVNTIVWLNATTSDIMIHYKMITYFNSCMPVGLLINPLTAKLFNPNFHPLEVVSR